MDELKIRMRTDILSEIKKNNYVFSNIDVKNHLKKYYKYITIQKIIFYNLINNIIIELLENRLIYEYKNSDSYIENVFELNKISKQEYEIQNGIEHLDPEYEVDHRGYFYITENNEQYHPTTCFEKIISFLKCKKYYRNL